MDDHSLAAAAEAALDPATLTYNVPDGWDFDNAGKCRSCGAPVGWARHSVTWKKAPFDPDGTSHFATCPDAQTWRRK